MASKEMAELQHPSPPASLSGEGLEGGVAAVMLKGIEAREFGVAEAIS